jgi:hypothetical protein
MRGASSISAAAKRANSSSASGPSRIVLECAQRRLEGAARVRKLAVTAVPQRERVVARERGRARSSGRRAKADADASCCPICIEQRVAEIARAGSRYQTFR